MIDLTIDKKATRNNVDKLLGRFHSYRRLSGIALEQMNDSIIEELSNVKSSRNEELSINLQRKQQAQIILKSILQTLNKIPRQSRERIEQRYISERPIREICREEALTKATYYRQLNKALIEFAETFNEIDLLVFDEES